MEDTNTPDPDPKHGPHSFATTQWTLVIEAGEPVSGEGKKALEELCRAYWRPLYAFVRRSGSSPAEAEDLTQAFFEDLLERDAIASADSHRGRFRTFLLTSFRNFQSKQRRAAAARKRGGHLSILSIDAMRETEESNRNEPATDESPDRLYERKWAGQLLAEALTAVYREYEVLGKGALFSELKTALWGGRREVSHADIAKKTGMTENAVKMAASRFRRRVGDQFRQRVAATVSGPEAIESEIRHLLAAVAERPRYL